MSTRPVELSPLPPPAPPSRGGFIQTFGLDVRAALLMVLLDMMAFSTTIVSAGLLYPVELGGAAMLAFITYRIQKHWYGDGHESALIKCLIVGMVTAVPVPITPLIAGPGGALGLLHLVFGKKRR